jgi:Peptidoglycan-binding protein, CsiV
MYKLTALMFAMMCLAPALAQQSVPEETLGQEPIRRYTVEVIIFVYAEAVGTGTEIFPPDPPPAVDESGFGNDAAGVHDMPGAAAAPAQDAAGPDLQDLDIALLTEDQFTMQNVLDRFDRLDVYRTIMHFGWTQAAYPEEATPAIELRLFGDPPAGLDGSFTLYLSRFLHLVVDLALTPPESSRPPAPPPEAPAYGDSGHGNARNRFDDGTVTAGPPVHYRIQENRIVKNGDLRYFDHPRFGVLAKVTRADDGAGPDADPSAGIATQ